MMAIGVEADLMRPFGREHLELTVAVAVGWLGVLLAAIHGSFAAARPFAALCLTGPAFVLTVLAVPASSRAPTKVGPRLSSIERAGLTALLAFALIPILALALQRLPGGLSAMGLSLAAAILGTVAAWPAALRASRAPRPTEAPMVELPRAALWALGIGGIVLAATALYVVPRMYEAPAFSEVLLLPEHGNLSDLSRPVQAGTATSYQLEIRSHERASGTFLIEWRLEQGNGDATPANFSAVATVSNQTGEVLLQAEGRDALMIAIPALDPGLYRLVAQVQRPVAGAQPLMVSAWIDARP